MKKHWDYLGKKYFKYTSAGTVEYTLFWCGTEYARRRFYLSEPRHKIAQELKLLRQEVKQRKPL